MSEEESSLRVYYVPGDNEYCVETINCALSCCVRTTQIAEAMEWMHKGFFVDYVLCKPVLKQVAALNDATRNAGNGAAVRWGLRLERRGEAHHRLKLLYSMAVDTFRALNLIVECDQLFRDAATELLTDDCYSHKRASIIQISLAAFGWEWVMDLIFANSIVLPSLVYVTIGAQFIDRFFPVTAKSLQIISDRYFLHHYKNYWLPDKAFEDFHDFHVDIGSDDDNPEDFSIHHYDFYNGRPGGAVVLSSSVLGYIADIIKAADVLTLNLAGLIYGKFANDKIYSCKIRVEKSCTLALSFPALKELSIYQRASKSEIDFTIDLSCCPRLTSIYSPVLTAVLLEKILMYAPQISHLPISLAKDGITDSQYRDLILRHAPHLIGPYETPSTFYWVPKLSSRFDRSLFAVFCMGVELLASVGAMPACNPAVLECIFRHCSNRDVPMHLPGVLY
jgi:hypothetical protein